MYYSKPMLIEAGSATEVIRGGDFSQTEHGGVYDGFDKRFAMALGLDD